MKFHDIPTVYDAGDDVEVLFSFPPPGLATVYKPILAGLAAPDIGTIAIYEADSSLNTFRPILWRSDRKALKVDDKWKVKFNGNEFTV